MAKNTLSFSEVKRGGTLSISDTATPSSETLWYGDAFTLAAGESVKVTLFGFGVSEVKVLSKASTPWSVAATLTPASPSYSSVSGGNFVLAVFTKDKGAEVKYEIERSPVTVSWDAVGAGENGGTEPTVITIGESQYIVDAVSYAPNAHIQLPKGDTIKCKTQDTSGAISLLYITNQVGIAPFEWERSSFTADRDTELCICAYSYYAPLSIQYQIINRFTLDADSSFASTLVYRSTEGFELKTGDKITLLTDDVDVALVNEAGAVATTLYHAGESYVATQHNDGTFYLASKESGVSELEYEILPDASRREYEAEYEGDSGILQLRHAMGARVKVYGDAGAGYMLIHEMEGKEIVRCVNMSGFNSIKLVSDGEVDECIINEF